MTMFPVVLFDAPEGSSYAAFGPQICQVTPLITTVQTTYDQTGIINVINHLSTNNPYQILPVITLRRYCCFTQHS